MRGFVLRGFCIRDKTGYEKTSCPPALFGICYHRICVVGMEAGSRPIDMVDGSDPRADRVAAFAGNVSMVSFDIVALRFDCVARLYFNDRRTLHLCQRTAVQLVA